MDGTIYNVKRCEWKFYISLSEYHYLRELLKCVMVPDPNMGDKGEYFIRSLYFDSADNGDYMAKIAGLEMRKKIRLRIYDTGDRRVKLEVKNRFNAYMLKESLVISKEEALRMISGDVDFLEDYHEPVGEKVKNLVRNNLYTPKVIVDYEREAFIHPEHNVRVTFDKNIRAAASDRLFDPGLLMTPLIREPLMVLEVKYDRMFPDYIKNAVSTARLLESSISKYCLAREQMG